jgi:MFS family permease
MDLEKPFAEHMDDVEGKIPVVVEEWTDDARVPAIKRKVDIRICAVLGALYVINQIDRINLGTAKVAGMDKSLKLVGTQYNTIVVVFFATYIIIQPFATVICRKVGPRMFITGLVAAWGCITLGTGFAKGWTTLVAMRVMLGLIEGGFFPSALFLLSMWYVRAEVAKRNAVLYLAGTIASGFGGILAYGVSLPCPCYCLYLYNIVFTHGWSWWTCRLALDLYLGGFVVRGKV